MTASSASELRCMSKHQGKRQQLPRHERQLATLHRGRPRWTVPTDGPKDCEQCVHSYHIWEMTYHSAGGGAPSKCSRLSSRPENAALSLPFT